MFIHIVFCDVYFSHYKGLVVTVSCVFDWSESSISNAVITSCFSSNYQLKQFFLKYDL